MPERRFTASDVITLPRMNASEAIAIGEAIVQAGKADPNLPTQVVAALNKVEQQHKSLSDAAASWVEPTDTKATERRTADRTIDSAWRAFHSWTKGWASLPADLAEEQSKAQQMLADLFDDGLRFTQLAWQQEWAESSARLQRIVDKGHDAVVAQLGGQRFLESLQTAHQAYGAALGITAAQPEPEPVPQIRQALKSFRSALRSYVLKVAAMEDEDDASIATRIQKLLAPLVG